MTPLPIKNCVCSSAVCRLFASLRTMDGAYRVRVTMRHLSQLHKVKPNIRNIRRSCKRRTIMNAISMRSSLWCESSSSRFGVSLAPLPIYHGWLLSCSDSSRSCRWLKHFLDAPGDIALARQFPLLLSFHGCLKLLILQPCRFVVRVDRKGTFIVLLCITF